MAVPYKGLLALDSLEMQSLKMYQSDLARVIVLTISSEFFTTTFWKKRILMISCWRNKSVLNSQKVFFLILLKDFIHAEYVVNQEIC